MEILIYTATAEDAHELALMNRMLIDDEGSDNPMAPDQLEARMCGWLAGEIYRAVLIHRREDVVGYLLYRQETDEFDINTLNIFVRHFFIKRAYRRRGIGRAAFQQVVNTHFPPNANIILEVIARNLQGRAFWESLGFQPHVTTYRLPARAEA